jgi:hypothetical protein
MGVSTRSCAWSGRHDVGHVSSPRLVRYFEYRLQPLLALKEAGTPIGGPGETAAPRGQNALRMGNSSFPRQP